MKVYGMDMVNLRLETRCTKANGARVVLRAWALSKTRALAKNMKDAFSVISASLIAIIQSMFSLGAAAASKRALHRAGLAA